MFENNFFEDMTMDRLHKKLEEYGESDFYPFHMPGHKRNPLSVACLLYTSQSLTGIMKIILIMETDSIQ